jgi:hypothetical protein
MEDNTALVDLCDLGEEKDESPKRDFDRIDLGDIIILAPLVFLGEFGEFGMADEEIVDDDDELSADSAPKRLNNFDGT